MSLGPTLAYQLRALRERLGAEVGFNDATYRVITEEIAGAKAGTDGLPRDVLGVLSASADPRVFVFSPRDFQPGAEAAPPVEGETLTWHGHLYVIAHVTWEDVRSETTQILVYAYRRTEPTAATATGVLPDTAVIVRNASVRDGAGGQSDNWADVATEPCRLERVKDYAEQVQGGRMEGITNWIARFRVGADVRIADRVRANGSTFEVVETDAGATDAPLLTAQLVRLR